LPAFLFSTNQRFSVPSFVHGVLLLTSRVGRESISFPANLRLSSPPQGSVLFARFRYNIVYVHLYLYVHRVEDLEPGVLSAFSGRSMQSWKESDQGGPTAWWRQPLSLGTRPSGKLPAWHFPMIGDFEKCLPAGTENRGYRYRAFRGGSNWPTNVSRLPRLLDWGQTGIGAFFDEEVKPISGASHPS